MTPLGAFVAGAGLVAIVWWISLRLAMPGNLAMRAREHEWHEQRRKGWEG
jgi:hypothetical protein